MTTLVEGEKISILELMDRQWQLAGIREFPNLTLPLLLLGFGPKLRKVQSFPVHFKVTWDLANGFGP